MIVKNGEIIAIGPIEHDDTLSGTGIAISGGKLGLAKDYATKAWVKDQHYLTSASVDVTKEWIEDNFYDKGTVDTKLDDTTSAISAWAEDTFAKAGDYVTYPVLEYALDTVSAAVDGQLSDLSETIADEFVSMSGHIDDNFAKIENTYTKDEVYNKEEIDDKLSHIDLSGYATKEYVDDVSAYAEDTYAKKDETYTKTQVDNLIKEHSGYKIVAGDEDGPFDNPWDVNPNIIYLVHDDTVQQKDSYSEWIVNQEIDPWSWTCIGDTSINLDDYATTAYVDDTASAITAVMSEQFEETSSWAKDTFVDKADTYDWDIVEYSGGDDIKVEDHVISLSAEKSWLSAGNGINIDTVDDTTVVSLSPANQLELRGENGITVREWPANNPNFLYIGFSGEYYTKAESDNRFQQKGSYVTTDYLSGTLDNYYTKQQTELAIDAKIADFGGFEETIGTSAGPTMDASGANVKIIYLVNEQVIGKDSYSEWIVTDNEGTKEWTCIGDTSINLADYATIEMLTDIVDDISGAMREEFTDTSAWVKNNFLSADALSDIAAASATWNTVSNKLDTTAFSNVSGTFLTDAALADYYTKSETSGADELSAAFANIQTTLSAGTDLIIADNIVKVNTDGQVGNSAEMSFVAGSATSATGVGAAAIGVSAYSLNNGSIAVGYQTSSIGGWGSYAEGYRTVASGMFSHAEGMQSTTDGTGSHAEGDRTSAVYNYAHAEGSKTLASAMQSHAEGICTSATGANSHAEGNTTLASMTEAHAEGLSASAIGPVSHAEGQQTLASGPVSHAEGISAIASGVASHAEGNSTKAIGYYAHAEGQLTSADGHASHAEGYQTYASTQSHSEGQMTRAEGQQSHAEGYSAYAMGDQCHAEGQGTTAYGNASHAAGLFTIISGNGAYAGGIFNKTSADTLFVLGNGTDASHRSDAFVIDNNGNVSANNFYSNNGVNLADLGPVYSNDPLTIKVDKSYIKECIRYGQRFIDYDQETSGNFEEHFYSLTDYYWVWNEEDGFANNIKIVFNKPVNEYTSIKLTIDSDDENDDLVPTEVELIGKQVNDIIATWWEDTNIRIIEIGTDYITIGQTDSSWCDGTIYDIELTSNTEDKCNYVIRNTSYTLSPNYCNTVDIFGSHIEGYFIADCVAENASHIEGNNMYFCSALNGSHIEGRNNDCGDIQQGSHLEGCFNSNITLVDGSHLEGYYCKDNNLHGGSHLEGDKVENNKLETGSHLEGYSNGYNYLKYGSHLEGRNNSGCEVFSGSHLAGLNNYSTSAKVGSTIEGDNNHNSMALTGGYIVGYNNYSTSAKEGSTIEGDNNNNSMALTGGYINGLSNIGCSAKLGGIILGGDNYTACAENGSLILGFHNEQATASYGAIVEGYSNTGCNVTSGSHIEGIGNITPVLNLTAIHVNGGYNAATNDFETVIGKYNDYSSVSSNNPLFVIGNGNTNTRSNAFIVTTDGFASATILGTSGISDIGETLSELSAAVEEQAEVSGIDGIYISAVQDGPVCFGISAGYLSGYQTTAGMTAYQTTAEMTGYIPTAASGSWDVIKYSGASGIKVGDDHVISISAEQSEVYGVSGIKIEKDANNDIYISISADYATSGDISVLQDQLTSANNRIIELESIISAYSARWIITPSAE